MLSWLGEFARYRSGKHLGEIKARAATRRAAHEIAVYSTHENDQIDILVAEATKELGKDQSEVADGLMTAVSRAWINLPTRNLLRDLWNGLEEARSGSASFLDVTSKLHEHSVPEAMGLAMTFAQRGLRFEPAPPPGPSEKRGESAGTNRELSLDSPATR